MLLSALIALGRCIDSRCKVSFYELCGIRPSSPCIPLIYALLSSQLKSVSYNHLFRGTPWSLTWFNLLYSEEEPKPFQSLNATVHWMQYRLTVQNNFSNWILLLITAYTCMIMYTFILCILFSFIHLLDVQYIPHLCTTESVVAGKMLYFIFIYDTFSYSLTWPHTKIKKRLRKFSVILYLQMFIALWCQAISAVVCNSNLVCIFCFGLSNYHHIVTLC